MAIFSCSKEATVDPIFVEKEFFIENPETATAKVLEFLSYTDLTEVTLRSNYPDTEVNEGLWTLEASSNYIDNVNLSLKSDITISYNLSVTNTVDNGTLKMSGTDMTDKFNQLQVSIAAEESNGRTAKIVDYKLGAVSNQQTDLVVGVVYSSNPPPPNVDGCQEWPESTDIYEAHTLLIDCLLDHVSNYAWYQTIIISNNDVNSHRILNCYESAGSGQSMYQLVGDVEPDEFDGAYAAAQDLIDCVVLDFHGGPAPSNTSYGPDLVLVDIDIEGSAIGSTSVFFCYEIIVGRGAGF